MPSATARRTATRRRRVLLVAALGLGVASCGSPTEPRVQAGKIVVSPGSVSVPQADSVQLSVSVLDKQDELISGIAVTFASSDTGILTVDNLGWVRGTGHAGSADVIVRSGGISTQVPVTVTPVLRGIVVQPNPATMPQKGTLQLQAAVLDAVGDTVPAAPITFASANQQLAVVSSSGLIVSAGPAGSTTIVASADTLRTTVTLTITQVPTSIAAPSTLNLGHGMQLQLAPRVLDAVGQPIAGATFTFASSDESIVTVSSTGLLTSAGPLGTATITVGSGVLSARIAVTVVDATHPAGTIVGTSSVNGSPWGVAISGTGTVYTALLGGGVARASVSSYTFDPPLALSGGTTGVAFSPDGSLAYVAGYADVGLAIVDVGSFSLTASVTQGMTGNAYDAAVSPDGSQVYLGADGHVYVIDPVNRSVAAAIPVPGAANHVTAHPSRPLVYASLFNAGTVVEVDVQANTVARTFAVGGTPQGSAVTPDGSTLYIANETGALDVLDLASGTVTSTVSLGCGGFGVALSPDRQQLYVACSNAGVVKVVDVASLSVIATINVGNGPRGVAFSKDGTVAAVAGGSSVVFIR